MSCTDPWLFLARMCTIRTHKSVSPPLFVSPFFPQFSMHPSTTTRTQGEMTNLEARPLPFLQRLGVLAYSGFGQGLCVYVGRYICVYINSDVQQFSSSSV